jgi:hypothetical protein
LPAVAFEIIAPQVEKILEMKNVEGAYWPDGPLGRKVPEETCEVTESENSKQSRKDCNSPVVKIRDG